MDTRKLVLDVIGEITGVDPDVIKPEMELVADLGLDSAKAVQMLVTLEERVDVEIDDEHVPRLQTVADVIAALDEVRA